MFVEHLQSACTKEDNKEWEEMREKKPIGKVAVF